MEGRRPRGAHGGGTVPEPALVEVREAGQQRPVPIPRTFPSTGLREGSAGG